MRITDNSRKSLTECSEQQNEDLRRIASIKLSDAASSNLLIFPKDFKQRKDGLSEQNICSIVNDELVTGNIMGFIGVNNTRLAITSRFENNGKDFFLHYMLQKVLALNVFDLKHSYDHDDSFDFLIYLFPKLLTEAYRQGIFKQYVCRQYNDANVKGTIDIARHIKQNPFFNGRIAYNTREYSYDNHITQLIRHTIEYLKNHPFAGQILKKDKNIKEIVAAFIAASPTYNRQQRKRIISENLRPLQHPFFTAYPPLQKLCLAILRHDELRYGRQKDEVYGVLFDGAWLWEEYLNTILSNVGFEHPRNKEGFGRKYLFQGSKGYFYPDFYRTNTIIDAKYKRVEKLVDGKIREEISREDLYQIITYLHVLEAKETGIIYPSINSPRQKVSVGTLNGLGGDVFTIPFPIPQNAVSMMDFRKQIEQSEDAIKKQKFS